MSTCQHSLLPIPANCRGGQIATLLAVRPLYALPSKSPVHVRVLVQVTEYALDDQLKRVGFVRRYCF